MEAAISGNPHDPQTEHTCASTANMTPEQCWRTNGVHETRRRCARPSQKRNADAAIT